VAWCRLWYRDSAVVRVDGRDDEVFTFVLFDRHPFLDIRDEKERSDE
jgi:hypothetical protein